MTNQTPPFAIGQRIKLLDMPDDPDPIPPGTTGTVLAVSSWLTGRFLGRNGRLGHRPFVEPCGATRKGGHYRNLCRAAGDPPAR